MIDHLTETQIKELARLEAAATKVLWWVEQCKPGQGAQAKTDFDFICAARSAIAPLLAERTALRAALQMVQRRWTFHGQDHTHTWHDWAECQPAIAAALAAGQGQGKERE